MYRLLILSIVLFSSALADVDQKECEKLFDPPAVRCCKKIAELEDAFMKSADIKECNQVNMDPALCEFDLCVAKKRGFATDDNKLDKTKIEVLMTKDFGAEADLMKDLKSECFNDNLGKYGPPELCDFIKIKNCLKIQMFKHCPDWEMNDACNEIKGLAQECGRTMF
uniref:OBP16 n=1 Tax=Mythimna loreyi TaxID=667449 RepID=A0AAU6NDC9_9NEOP